MLKVPITTTEISYRFFVNGRLIDTAAGLKNANKLYDTLLRQYGFDVIEIQESVANSSKVPARASGGYTLGTQAAGLPDAVCEAYRKISPDELRCRAYLQKCLRRRQPFDFNL